MIIPILGALFGAGTVALILGLRPPRVALAEVLAAIEAPTPPGPAAPAAEGEWATRLGKRAVPMVRALGFPTKALRSDLAVCGTDIEAHLAGKAACAMAGLLTPWVAAALFTFAGGVPAGWWVPLSGSLALAAVLFFAPDLTVRKQAEERRREMRHTLAVVLDLTVIGLAGGAGVQQALGQAVAGPRGWAAGKVRHALHVAELTRTNPCRTWPSWAAPSAWPTWSSWPPRSTWPVARAPRSAPR